MNNKCQKMEVINNESKKMAKKREKKARQNLKDPTSVVEEIIENFIYAPH